MSETTPLPANPAPANESVPAIVEDRFVHLHLHTDYSILDGLVDPYTLVRTAGHLGQPAVAITDHGRLSGTAEFYDAIGWYNRVHAERHPQGDDCLKNGCHSVLDCRAEKRCPKKGSAVGAEQHAKITPLLGILGLETYVAHHGRESREKGDWGHLVLLSKNERGWANLRALASRASLEGFYSKPRVDRELLAEVRAIFAPVHNVGHVEGQRGILAALRKTRQIDWAFLFADPKIGDKRRLAAELGHGSCDPCAKDPPFAALANPSAIASAGSRFAVARAVTAAVANRLARAVIGRSAGRRREGGAWRGRVV